MLPLSVASRLRTLGLRWEPTPGDRFVLADRDMDDDVFVLSDMTIEVHDFPTGRIIGFNGTTEWALDSVEQQEALWVPREDQLRRLLGDDLVALLREADGWRVGLADGSSFDAADAEEAYGAALVHVMERRDPAAQSPSWSRRSSSGTGASGR